MLQYRFSILRCYDKRFLECGVNLFNLPNSLFIFVVGESLSLRDTLLDHRILRRKTIVWILWLGIVKTCFFLFYNMVSFL